MNNLPSEAAARAWTAEQWANLLDRAGVSYTTGDQAAKVKKAIPAGRWLGARLERPVPITVGGRPAVAELRAVMCRGKVKKYVLLVRHTGAESEPESAPAGPVAELPTPPTPPGPDGGGGDGGDWW